MKETRQAKESGINLAETDGLCREDSHMISGNKNRISKYRGKTSVKIDAHGGGMYQIA